MSSLAETTVQMKYVEIGTMIAMILFGMSTVQVYIYFRGCGTEPRWMKFSVGVIWMLEFAHTFLSGHTVYILTALDLNPSRTVMDIGRINDLSGLIAASISSFCQACFSFRLYIISRSIWLPGVGWILSALKLVSFYTAVIHDISGGQMDNVWRTLLLITAITSWAGDLLVAVGLLLSIRVRHRERVYQKNKTDTVLRWCLETNLLTCLSSSLTFIFYELNHGNFANWLWVPLALITCRLYSMCIFASFIGRRHLKDPIVNSADPELAMFNFDGPQSFIQAIPTETSRVE